MSKARVLANLGAVTSTAAELNIMDGVTANTAELNIMDGVTANTVELNIMDGVTSTAAELNALDGITSDVNDLNYAKTLYDTGVTGAEFDQLDTTSGVAGSGNFLRGDKTWAAAGSPSITDNGNATAMTIDISENVTYTGNIIMPTNKKVQQKAAFLQSSTHQALVLG